MGELEPLLKLQGKIRQRRYRLTAHAERERESDRITSREIEESLLSEQAEIVESYPDDVRGKSYLVLGFTKSESPIHAVCGLAEEELIVITVYRPDPELWTDWRRRKRTKT